VERDAQGGIFRLEVAVDVVIRCPEAVDIGLVNRRTWEADSGTSAGGHDPDGGLAATSQTPQLQVMENNGIYLKTM
jgi:hypothetical protein